MRYDLVEAGRRIRELRKDRGLTQVAFAEMFHTTLSHVGKIEKGTRGASIELLVDIAGEFDVSLDYLILGKSKSERQVAESKIVIRSAIESLLEIEKRL